MSNQNREQLGESLSAYIDGELDEQQTQLVERALREDEGARQLLDELRQTISAVSSLPRHAAPDSIYEQVQRQLERSELLCDVEPSSSLPVGRGLFKLRWFPLAAMLGLTVIGGMWILSDRTGRDGGIGEDVVALAPTEKSFEQPSVWPRHLKETPDSKTAKRGGPAVPRPRRRAVADGARRKATRMPSTLPISTEADGQVVSSVTSELSRSGEARVEQDAGLSRAAGRSGERLSPPGAFSDIRAYRFENESFRLQVTARDEAERDALVNRLTARLRQDNVADLSLPSANARRRGKSGQGYFYQGRPGVNFDRGDARQIIVRATPRTLNALVDELEQGTNTPQAVALHAGPLVFSGWQEARRVVRRLEGRADGATPQRDEAAPTGASRTADLKPKVPAKGYASAAGAPSHDTDVDTIAMLDELLKAIGLGPDYRSAPSPQSEETHPKTERLQRSARRVKKGHMIRPDAESEEPPRTESAGLELDGHRSLVQRRLGELANVAGRPASSRSIQEEVRGADAGIRESLRGSPVDQIAPEQAGRRQVTFVIEVGIAKSKPTASSSPRRPAHRPSRKPPAKPRPPQTGPPAK